MARILVIGPHPDDQELGMGATIARLADQGHTVTLLDVTNGEPTPYGDPETRAQEAAAAARVLSPTDGSNPVRRILLDMPNREVTHSVQARHTIAACIRAVGVQADVMFLPYFEDAHPDHRAVTRIAEDARFDSKLTKLEMPTLPAQPDDDAYLSDDELVDAGPRYPRWLLYYYCTHLRWVADPTFLLDTTGYEERKRESIVAYHTQFVVPEKNRKVVEWIGAAGSYFGSRIGTPSAEPFYSKEPLGLTGLGELAL